MTERFPENRDVACEINRKFILALGYWKDAPRLAKTKNKINELLQESMGRRLNLTIKTNLKTADGGFAEFNFSPSQKGSEPTRRVFVEDVWGEVMRKAKKNKIVISTTTDRWGKERKQRATRGSIADFSFLVIMAKRKDSPDFHHARILGPSEIVSIEVS